MLTLTNVVVLSQSGVYRGFVCMRAQAIHDGMCVYDWARTKKGSRKEHREHVNL